MLIDINTLEEEGKTRNHLVSLIVDNKGSYVAAITRRSIVKSNITSTISYNSFNNKEFNYQENEEEEKVKLEYFNLDIEFDSYKMDSEYINIQRIEKEETPINDLDTSKSLEDAANLKAQQEHKDELMKALDILRLSKKTRDNVRYINYFGYHQASRQ